MNLRQHPDRDDMKVWLSADEIDAFLDAAPSQNRRLAFALGVRCGLRSEEVTDVRPQHVTETDAGRMLRVPDGKGGKYRETPIPHDLAQRIEMAVEYRDEPDDHPVVTSQAGSPGVSTRTLRRWVESAREQLAEETGDDGWRHLTFHDLRATWATQLRSADVDSMVVCDWGGWNDLETFLDHYRGTHTPEAQRREREKVEWLQ
jgi:integrase